MLTGYSVKPTEAFTSFLFTGALQIQALPILSEIQC